MTVTHDTQAREEEPEMQIVEATAGQSPVSKPLENSWLVQRLKRPLRREGVFGGDNPFAFGGGLVNGGLSDEAMGLLRDIFSFDYMGSAEFEFGEVPKALTRIARAKLSAFSFAVPLAEVPPNWRDKAKTKGTGEATIYALAPADYAADVEERIRAWTRAEHADLKEGLRLTNALRPVEEWDGDVCGWLELDNGFLFFTDREMWEKTCALFGVALTQAALPLPETSFEGGTDEHD